MSARDMERFDPAAIFRAEAAGRAAGERHVEEFGDLPAPAWMTDDYEEAVAPDDRSTLARAGFEAAFRQAVAVGRALIDQAARAGRREARRVFEEQGARDDDGELHDCSRAAARRIASEAVGRAPTDHERDAAREAFDDRLAALEEMARGE